MIAGMDGYLIERLTIMIHDPELVRNLNDRFDVDRMLADTDVIYG